jgi:adenosine deaminase
MENHNLKKLLDLGLRVTVNSDDPAYFGGYMLENFQAVQQALNLKEKDIVTLVKNSFQASFLSEDDTDCYLAEVDAFVANWERISDAKGVVQIPMDDGE